MVKADVQAWEQLSPFLTTEDGDAPIAVPLLVLGLLNGAEVRAGCSDFRSVESSSIWRTWLITDETMVYTDVEFAAAGYSQLADDEMRRTHPVGLLPTVREAWVRPLTAVASVRIGSVGTEMSGFRRDWYPIDVVLTFADGGELALPVQSGVSPYARDASDQFLAAVRTRICL